MSVDMQVSGESRVDAESLVGRPCYVTAGGVLGAVTGVEPGGALMVALEVGRTVSVAADDVVVLPQVGEFVEVPRHGGVLCGYWVGLVPATDDGGLVTARVVAGGEVVEHRTEAASLLACRVVSGSADPSVAGAIRAAAQVCSLLDAERRGYEAWKESLNEAACDRADDQGWCSDFDAFMNDWGMQGRRRTYEVEVEVTGTVTIRVEAANASDAQETVSRAQIIDAASSRLDNLDFDVKDAEEA